MLNTNYREFDAKAIQLYDDTYSEEYREFDYKYVVSPDYAHFAPVVKKITKSFTDPIKVLEIGCGTGRYFHVLENTEELTGIDISESMLNMAKEPVRSSDVKVPIINLIQGSVFEHDFGTEKFDFIFSIGVLGEHTPLPQDLCHKIYNLLNDGGCFYFTVVDIDDRKNVKRKIAEAAYPFLPARIKQVLDKRWESNYFTKAELIEHMKVGPFDAFEVSNYKADNSGWTGAHHECIGYKGNNLTKRFFE
ncbi:MAG: class I SAM-dependent methyltransferase [Chitinophagales bacterium]|nr:class I SAM-dependent methyltransferase [Chitinophagaceae bacterium]MCB9065730.1 class I SAM-dependent methyltransferase [Chitinophagales bacterium]